MHGCSAGALRMGRNYGREEAVRSLLLGWPASGGGVRGGGVLGGRMLGSGVLGGGVLGGTWKDKKRAKRLAAPKGEGKDDEWRAVKIFAVEGISA